MQPVVCATCDITFGLSDQLYRKRKEDGQGFMCPHGHSSVFHPSKADRLASENAHLRRRVDKLEHQRDFWEEQYDELATEWREQGKALTKAKLRTAGYKRQWLRVKNLLESAHATA